MIVRLFEDRNFRRADADLADQAVNASSSHPATHAHTKAAHANRHIFRRMYEGFALYSGWAAFGVICLLSSAFGGIAYHLLPRLIGAKVGQRVVQGAFRTFLGYLYITGLVKCDLTALDALKGERGLILAPNHPSMLDAVLVISRLPRVTCIMKAALWDNIVLGGGSRLAGYVRNDSQPNMVRASVQALQDGGQVLIFPEGTRTVATPVNDFKGAIALIAKKSQAPVQTIFIESNTEFLGKHWPTLKMPTFPLRYTVRLGKRFECGADHKTFLADLETYFRTESRTEFHNEMAERRQR
jgi:1-acyl-sn-glycerol-3-phosphate acyltransferase